MNEKRSKLIDDLQKIKMKEESIANYAIVRIDKKGSKIQTEFSIEVNAFFLMHRACFYAYAKTIYHTRAVNSISLRHKNIDFVLHCVFSEIRFKFRSTIPRVSDQTWFH